MNALAGKVAIVRVLEINGLRTISREVVETARESLIIGTL
jgi:hypothetical protein